MLLFERHALVRAALSAMIGETDGLSVAGAVASLEEAVSVASTQFPDVILIDGRTAADICDETIVALHRAAPRACLMILTDDAAGIKGAARMLATCVSHDSDLDALRGVIATRFGVAWESCAVKTETHDQWGNVSLSRRETHVAVRIATGMTSKQIAHDIGVSLRTVHTYRESLARKLGASSAAVITRFVIERNIRETTA